MTSRKVGKIVTAVVLTTFFVAIISYLARADHHAQDECPDGHAGNCSGPGDVQDRTFNLGRFSPGDVFRIGYYWKERDLDTDRCELAWWTQYDGWLSPTGPFEYNFEALGPEFEAYVEDHNLNAYQYGGMLVNPSVPECPGCPFEHKLRIVRLPGEPPHMPADIGDPNNPFGWMSWQINSVTPESQEVFHLALSKGWELRANDGVNCGCDAGQAGNTCRDAYIDWQEHAQNANQFVYVVDCYTGDFTGDGIVGGEDFGVFARAFGSLDGDPSYDWDVDSNADGAIGGPDFGAFLDQLVGGPTVCD